MAVTAMPDGRLLTTDKSGFMQIFDQNGKLVKKITGFPDVVDQGQIVCWMWHWILISPGTKLYIGPYAEKNGKGNLLAVAKGKLDDAASTIQQRS
jgi:hypothetical protein